MISRRQGLAVCALALAVGVVGASTVYTIHTFGLRDPTEGGVTVALLNDTGGLVHLAFCETTGCPRPRFTQTVAPGRSASLRADLHVSIPFLVSSVAADDECRVLDVGDRPRAPYRLSETRRCP